MASATAQGRVSGGCAATWGAEEGRGVSGRDGPEAEWVALNGARQKQQRREPELGGSQRLPPNFSAGTPSPLLLRVHRTQFKLYLALGVGGGGSLPTPPPAPIRTSLLCSPPPAHSLSQPHPGRPAHLCPYKAAGASRMGTTAFPPASHCLGHRGCRCGLG